MSIFDWFKPKPTLSPGPPGGWLDDDYRVPIRWLASPTEATTGGNYGRRFKHQGRDRYYEIHLPRGYARGEQWPLVLVLHGGGGYASVARYQTGFDAVSDDDRNEKFIVVYPAATGEEYTDRLLYWNAGVPPLAEKQKSVDDVDYIRTVLTDMRPLIDTRRIYCCGMSNGSHMTFRLAGEFHFAAIGGVAGQRAVGQYASPPKQSPMPLIYFHGSRDEWYAPFSGGRVAFGNFEPFKAIRVWDAVESWATFNGWTHQAMRPAKIIGTAQQYIFNDSTEYWQLGGGGHTWPGGRKTKIENAAGVGEVNRDINASQLMWEFFKRFSL